MGQSGVSDQRYRTIVVDPPWPYREVRKGDATTPASPICTICGGAKFRGRLKKTCQCSAPDWGATNKEKALPYGSMSMEDIQDLPIDDLAHPAGAHLYLWTTQRFLGFAFDLIAAWGFAQTAVLVWKKEPKGFGRPFVVSAEFVLVARRGSITYRDANLMGTVFEWPRPGDRHSAKPDAFLDLVERISPGPYAELFSRRARFGWDYPIGDQALGGRAA